MSATINRNDAESRYEIRESGELAGIIDYRETDGVRDLFHTEVFEGFTGRGVAAELVAGALIDLRESGIELIPTCPYIQSCLRKNPGDLALVPTDRRGDYDL